MIDDLLTITPARMAIIPPELAGERLDRALVQLDGTLSRASIQRLLREAAVQRNGLPIAAADCRLKTGDRLEWRIPACKPAEAQPEAITLVIIHEDQALIVIDKAAGMTVHPAPGQGSGTLVNALLYHGQSMGDGSWSGVGGVLRPGIVHRLDKDTSGLLVAAKNDTAHLHLAAQFKAHTAFREYLAVIKGTPIPPSGTVNAPIGRHPRHRQKMAVVAEDRGRAAITHYRLVESLGPFNLISCRLETGRTHQIRVHMAHIGHPLLGDPLYGRPFTPPLDWPESVRQVVTNFKRQALHATNLEFEHPNDGQRRRFHAPIPADLAELIAALRQVVAGTPGLS